MALHFGLGILFILAGALAPGRWLRVLLLATGASAWTGYTYLGGGPLYTGLSYLCLVLEVLKPGGVVRR